MGVTGQQACATGTHSCRDFVVFVLLRLFGNDGQRDLKERDSTMWLSLSVGDFALDAQIGSSGERHVPGGAIGISPHFSPLLPQNHAQPNKQKQKRGHGPNEQPNRTRMMRKKY